jgi:CRP/FNR family cyclic AMP-dependent transcriptional regulator
MTTQELFAGVAPDDASAILELGSRRDLPAGRVLFRLGDEADTVYLVEHGRIALMLPMQVAGLTQDVLVDERRAGQIVGWSALIPPYRFTLTGTSPLDSSVLAIPREALLACLTERPRAGLAVMLNLAAVIGQRLQVMQAMWLREMQRVVNAHA